MTRNEEIYLGRLTRLGCVVCREFAERCGLTYEPPDPSLQLTVIHHLREGEGMAQRAPNWLAVPLCVADHTGKNGVHGDKGRLRQLKADEMDLLAWTIRLFFETYF